MIYSTYCYTFTKFRLFVICRILRAITAIIINIVGETSQLSSEVEISAKNQLESTKEISKSVTSLTSSAIELESNSKHLEKSRRALS